MEAVTATFPAEMDRQQRATLIAQTAAYFAAFVCLGLTIGLLGPSLPALAQQAHAGLEAISYLFTLRALGYVLGAVSSGKLFDRRPGNPLAAAMLLAMAVTTALVPLASHISLLLAAMVVLGAAEAALDVGANTLLVWVHGSRVAPFMNAMHAFFGVGALAAPAIVAQVMFLNYPATHSYFVVALLLLPAAVFMLRLPSPHDGSTRVLERPARINYRLVFLIALFLFLYVGAEVSFAGWIFTYTLELKLSSATAAALLTSLFWGALTLGRMLTIPIATRFTTRSVLRFSLAGCLLSIGLILLAPRSFASVLIATAGLGLSMASIFPTTLSLAGETMRVTGRLTGWFVLGSSTGSMLIPLIVGQLFRPFGPQVLMLLMIVTLLAAAGVLFVIGTSSAAAVKEEAGT